MICGSGLSGMVSAYISAKALDDSAAHDESWHAEQAFRPKRQGWVGKWLPSRRGGTTTAVS
ncbi:hypothetical protein AB4Y87_03310 [Paenarthrobacter sp. RAF54_2]|uniref:hypothetical protein n=1 Tax=Paenarthrobacter sp. RAF54_2 TaxID=3233061 RepID=UPI003F94B9AB